MLKVIECPKLLLQETVENHGCIWHLHEYYMLKNKTDDEGTWFKQRINFKSKLSPSQLKKREKDYNMLSLKVY